MGNVLGIEEGKLVGIHEGTNDGTTEGTEEGGTDGILVGAPEGTLVGLAIGDKLGRRDELEKGSTVEPTEEAEGILEGELDRGTLVVGRAVG